MRAVRTLVMLGSEKAVRFLVHEGPGRKLQELPGIEAADFPDVTVEYSDRPGRSSAVRGEVGLHALDPHETERDFRRERFAAHAVAALSAEWGKGGYDRIIIAAPPKFLGELRDGLPATLAAAVVADLPKDLVKVPLHEMAPHFAEVLPV